jgi:predicted unusual protein kinase regulating ubiquinone biosynthesis (AarF/ABC1/UbiB family)
MATRHDRWENHGTGRRQANILFSKTALPCRIRADFGPGNAEPANRRHPVQSHDPAQGNRPQDRPATQPGNRCFPGGRPKRTGKVLSPGPTHKPGSGEAIQTSLGDSPENLFQSFDDRAFAAASLGQVHHAVSRGGEALAVKIQYPGIAGTIENDISLVRSILRPLGDYHLLKPALDEIQTRLLEEIDYRKEAENVRFFKSRLNLVGVHIPDVNDESSHKTVISTHFFKGLPLDLWLKKPPSKEMRNRVAQSLQDLFIQCLYGLRCIHADPNPGNFLIADDLTVGLVDFGCVKHLGRSFTDNYARIPKIMVSGEKEMYFGLLDTFHIISPMVGPHIKEALFEALTDFRPVFGRLFAEEYFDFGQNSDFIARIKPVREHIYRLRHHIEMNPDFVFLDRTRYGLLRIFEQMQACLTFRNNWEWPV